VIPSTTRIFVCLEPQDMRRGFDGLALAAKEQLGEDPQSGALFIFTNKRRNRLKVLWFDRNGYCLLYKRAAPRSLRAPRDARRRREDARVHHARRRNFARSGTSSLTRVPSMYIRWRSWMTSPR